MNITMRLNRALIILGASYFSLGAVGAASAAISSISYFHYVEIQGQFFSNNSQQLSGSALPINGQTLSFSNDGDTSSATYNFTDNGAVATLKIDSSFSESPSTLLDTSENGSDSITFPQPVDLSFTGGITSIGTSNNVEFETILRGGPGNAFIIDDPTSNSSGTNPSLTAPSISNELIPAGTYSLFELSSLSAGGTATGTGSVQLTFTAVPEPTSLSLLAVGGLVLLGRIRRK